MSVSDGDDHEDQQRSLLILYATETGTAQDAADYIARQCRRIAFHCRVASIDTYSLPELLSEEMILFVISTTGSGVEPRSMTPLWTSLLRSDIPPDALEDLPFSVFGLGDTSYEKFCWAAKKLSRRLQSLGGVEFYERGEGDEQHPLGIDDALHPWTEGLLKRLLEVSPLPPSVDVVPVNDTPPARVTIRDAVDSAVESPDHALGTDSQYHEAQVTENKRITADDWNQDVRHLDLIFTEDIQYSPGDVAVVHPVASSSDVEEFLELVGWDKSADKPICIERAVQDQTLPEHLPKVTTLRSLFSRFLDLNAVPRRSFFQYLRYFTTSDLERERLDEFLSPEGADELYEYCHRVRRTIFEVLTEFRYVKLPRDYIFDIFPPLRPREFSIASSIKTHPNHIQLCIAVVKYRTKLKVPRKGVCTSYISALQPGDKLQIGIKKGLLRLPAGVDTPVICVGPGTGIAPMRSVIEERIAAGSSANFLYFGCRSSSKDHHYGSEWRGYTEEQKIHYRVAFSRDGPEGEKRTYVQDLMQQDAAEIWNLVGKQEGWVLISGSANKMPAAVRSMISYAAETHGEMTLEESKRFVEDMVKEGRLIEECWS